MQVDIENDVFGCEVKLKISEMENQFLKQKMEMLEDKLKYYEFERWFIENDDGIDSRISKKVRDIVEDVLEQKNTKPRSWDSVLQDETPIRKKPVRKISLNDKLQITDELASFLGKDNGIEMSRAEVIRDMHAYIHDNNLQDKVDGRKINPDAKLVSLLKLDNSDALNYLNLSRYITRANVFKKRVLKYSS
jgi:hypothetical protein